MVLIRFLLILAVVLLPPRGRAQQQPAVQVGRPGQSLDVDNTGMITIADREQNLLVVLNGELRQVREIGGFGWGNDQFDQPSGIWARNGIDVFVADYGNHRIQRFDGKLNYISTLSTRSSDNPDERFGYPTDVTVSRFGDLYICDSENSRILKVSSQDRVTGSIGGIDAGQGRLNHPTKVAIGPDDHVFVIDVPRVVVFDAFGNFSGVLADGVFRTPSVLYGDAQGAIVVDGDMVYGFDAQNRPACAVKITTLLGANHTGPLFSLAVNRGRCYCLTPDGVTIVPDPRFSPPGSIDKEGKSE